MEEIQEGNIMSEMNFGMLIKEILDRCRKLEFELDFGADHCVLHTGELQIPFHNLERVQGFIEGIEYALDYMVEEVKDDSDD